MYKCILLSTLLACQSAFGSVYVIKSGDTLSDILFSKISGRIYGPNGNLAKLLVLNPHLENQDTILVGEKIKLPDFSGERSLTQVEVAGTDPSSAQSASQNTQGPRFKKEESNQAVSFSLGLSSVSLNATELLSGSNEIATSDLAFGVAVRWTHKWSSKLNFLLDASLTKYQFKVAADKVLTKKKHTKVYAGIGLKYIQNQKHQYTVALGLGESLLLTSENLSTLKVNKAVIPDLSIAGNHILKTFKTGFSFNSFWKAGALLPSSQVGYSTKLGSYWSVGAGSTFNQNEKFFKMSLSYGQRSLKTETVKQATKGMGVNAGIGLNF